MKIEGVCKLDFWGLPTGSAVLLKNREEGTYIDINTIELDFYGEKLIPNQFDKWGNPQFGGLAGKILIYKIRQKVHDGIIDNEYCAEVNYSYSLSNESTVEFIDRLPRINICQICNKKLPLSLENVDNINNIVVHDECTDEYYKLDMIDNIMSGVKTAFGYNTKWGGEALDNITYKVIPNEYCGDSCRICARQPWFIFRTPFGHLKIGWRKRVINITFMEDFKHFDMEIFKDENVTKWGDNTGERGIHAWGYEKYDEYLYKVIRLLKKENESVGNK